MKMEEFKKTELGKETYTLKEIMIIKKQLNNKIKSLSVRNYHAYEIGLTKEINYHEEQLNNFLVDLLDDLGDYLFEEFSKKYYYVQDPFEKIDLISNRFKEILRKHLEEGDK